MRYKLFGRSGLRVSEFGLGTLAFGEDWQWGANAEECRRMFELYANAGGNFIDTAHFYTNGSAEKLVGEFIRGDRDHFVISTKYTPSHGRDPIRAGNSRKNMVRCVEESLRRLGIDCIDIFWLHFWDFTTPLDEILRGFDDLVSAGKVHYIGASDTPAWQISRANMLADLRGWAPFIGVQVQYSLAERSAERDTLPMAQELDLGVAVFNLLAGGILTGKYLDNPEARTNTMGIAITEHSQHIARVVRDTAATIGISPSQLVLAAARQQQRWSLIPILGARSEQQLAQNLAVLDIELDDAVVKELDTVSAIELGEPMTMLSSRLVRDLATAKQAHRFDNHRAPRWWK